MQAANITGAAGTLNRQAKSAARSAFEGANLDTMQAWQMRLNLQDVFKMTSLARAAKYLARWHTWVKISELKPMIKAANTIMSKSSEILRAISNNLSNGLLEAINGNVQAAKRKAKGYRTKRNLKSIIYLIANRLCPFNYRVSPEGVSPISIHQI